MPNIKSAKKRVLVNQAKAARNRARKSAMKTSLKKAFASKDATPVVDAAAPKYAREAADPTLEAIRRVDQAAAKGLIHKNAAARKKSQLMRLRAGN
ncbi:MAG: 30S ribosomal protein S20 [Oscillospiraceae bacterium]|jgi:small subunit ribosomal protein S20|nr:30S ribosomal protein S20 [Oscillospiraceae bacterium]